VKPSGTASAVLGTASGIHPQHAKWYIRRVQANKTEFPAQHFQKINPMAVERSVWGSSGTDVVISFLCEVPKGAITKNQLTAIEMLEKVKIAQRSWVVEGTNEDLCVNKTVRHNVSNTCIIKNEWSEVADYIYNNRKSFTGISLLSFSGDKDYAQAPFTTIHSSKELERMYGDAAVFASGLIVDGLSAYDENLWGACDCLLGIGEKIEDSMDKPIRPVKNGYSDKKYAEKLTRFLVECEIHDAWFAKKDWNRRVEKFASRYFEGDIRKTCYCMKDVCNRHLWCNLKFEYKEIDWATVHEPNPHYESVDSMGAVACSGGACDLV